MLSSVSIATASEASQATLCNQPCDSLKVASNILSLSFFSDKIGTMLACSVVLIEDN